MSTSTTEPPTRPTPTRARLIVGLGLLAALGAGALSWSRRSHPLVIVYSGNLQASMLTTTFSSAQSEVALSKRSIPRMGTVQDAATQARALVDEAHRRGDSTLLLDVGNTLQGSDLLSHVEGAEPAARILAEAGYDGLFCSTAEWVLGTQALARVQEHSGLTLACSNLPGPAHVAPLLRRDSRDRHVVVYGWYEPPHSSRLPELARTLPGLDFSLERRQLAERLKSDGATEHVVVADVDDVDALARELPVRCLVIPARYSGREDLSALHAAGLAQVAPWVDARRGVGKVTVVGSAAASQLAAEVVPLSQEPAPVPPHLAESIKRLEGRLGPEYQTLWERFLAYSPEHLAHEVEKYAPSPAAQWVCDRMRERLGGEVALLNHKALRELIRHFVQFEGQVIYLDPFGNTLVVVALPGRDLAELLRRNALENRRYLQVSGAHVRYRKGDDKQVELVVNGEPLDERRTYRVVVNDYLADGAHDQEPLLKRAQRLARTTICLNFELFDAFNAAGWVVPPAHWVDREARGAAPASQDPAAVARRGAFAQAWKLYQQRLQAQPHDEATRVAAAELLLDAELPELAEATLLKPDTVPGLLLAGRIHVAMRRWEQAQHDLERACALGPKELVPHVYLGWIAFHQADAQLARRAWSRAQRLATLIDAATLNRLVDGLPRPTHEASAAASPPTSAAQPSPASPQP
jgi:tetratricopeptide (TPR) repeat protein